MTKEDQGITREGRDEGNRKIRNVRRPRLEPTMGQPPVKEHPREKSDLGGVAGVYILRHFLFTLGRNFC
jgi:hypothetical protein